MHDGSGSRAGASDDEPTGDREGMRVKEFTCIFPFGGIAGGALGFQRATAMLERLGVEGRFKVLGGIDFDPLACQAFTYLTGAPCHAADIRDVTPEMLRAWFGETAPDVVFWSPPCKGASGLISDEKAATETYSQMNELALVWTRLMLATWARPPKLLLLENVPRIATRAKKMLDEVCRLLRKAKYVLHKGKHDCGKIGKLAQHRERFLMLARLADEVPQFVYQPPEHRVRGCGEVLGELPLPGAPSAGPMHTIPRISMLNWLRLAMIPAGGDWRDLAGVLAKGQTRREGWGRYHVCAWEGPTPSVTGSGTNGAYAVADTRCGQWFGDVLGVVPWSTPLGTVTGRSSCTTGGFTVADPRVTTAFRDGYGVGAWNSPSCTITGEGGVPNGRFSVADPRVATAFDRGYSVLDWTDPSNTIAGKSHPGNGAFSVADARLTADRYGMNYRVTSWGSPSWTVTGNTDVQAGLPIVADPRLNLGPNGHTNILGVTSWRGPAKTVTSASRPSSGAVSVADPRLAADNPGRHTAKYAVTDWTSPARTVTGTDGRVGSGAPCTADPRLTCTPWTTSRAYGVLHWNDPSFVVTGSAQIDNGPWSVSDPRAPTPPFGCPTIEPLASGEGVKVELAFWCLARVEPEPFFVRWYPNAARFSWKDAPPWPVVIVAADGTWHRPITVLEAARLQGLPAVVRGAPLVLPGKSSASWREWIGNMVPVGAAEAIARQMLLTLVNAAYGVFTLSGGGGDVWVNPKGAPSAIETHPTVQ